MARARRKGGPQSARTKSPAVGPLGPKQLCQPLGRKARRANPPDNAERTHHHIGGRWPWSRYYPPVTEVD